MISKAVLLRYVLLLSCLSTVLQLNSVSMADTVVIPVDFRSAEEVLPLMEHLLSDQGRAVADPRSNSLVVTDTPEAIAAVRSFLTRADQPARQVTVRVRFGQTRSATDRSVSVGGAVSVKTWTIGTPGAKPNQARVTARDANRSRREFTESFVRTGSGSTAYIAAGQDIPYRERWVQLSRRYATIGERTVFQRVETGMEVTPFVTGSTARLSIVPRIGYVDESGRNGQVRFARAATELTAPLGQWVGIGGTRSASNEVMDAILASGSASGQESLTIELMVEAD